jgi:hypothetical protein
MGYEMDARGVVVSSHQTRRVTTAEGDTLCPFLGDKPQTLITVHLLRRGLCSAYAVGELNCPDALVVQPTPFPEEPTVFGTDAEAIWLVLCNLPG